MEPETIRELDGSAHIGRDPREMQHADFAGFLKAYVWVTRKLDSPAAYALATRRLLERLAAAECRAMRRSRCRRASFFGRSRTSRRSSGRASTEAQDFGGVKVAWIFDAIRQFGTEPAARVFAARKRDAGRRSGGHRHWRRRSARSGHWFKQLYAEAREAGLRLTCHAGEVTGPESVWEALEIGAERIGHGIRAIEDPRLLEVLREKDVTFGSLPFEQRLHTRGCRT